MFVFHPVGEKQVEITDLPDWAQPAFKGMKSLNRVQSRVSDCALYSSENMLVCAPTGEAVETWMPCAVLPCVLTMALRCLGPWVLLYLSNFGLRKRSSTDGNKCAWTDCLGMACCRCWKDQRGHAVYHARAGHAPQG